MEFARRRGFEQAVAVTEVDQLAAFRGHQLIVLPGYISAPHHAELLVAARRYGLEVWWES